MEPAQLVITGPDGTTDSVDLRGERVTIGRRAAGYEPDITLEDPDGLISRRHCQLVAAYGSWWLEDCGSRNGTYMEVDGQLIPVEERVRLEDGAVIGVIAEADGGGAHRLWRLTLVDSSATAALDAPVGAGAAADVGPCVRWDPHAFQLVVCADGQERTVELRRQGYQLVDFMAGRNAELDGAPAVCSVDDILEGVWGDPSEWDRYRPPTAQNVRDLVAAVRREIEADTANPRILENIRGVGYRLNSC